MTHIRTLVLAAAVAVIVVSGACGSDDDPGVDAGDGAQPPAAGAPTPDGGLTVAEAQATAAEGPVAVRGFVVAHDDAVRLCDALAESYPPQCGGESLAVEGLDLEDLPDVQQVQGTSWTDQPVTVVGLVEGDVLRVDPTAT